MTLRGVVREVARPFGAQAILRLPVALAVCCAVLAGVGPRVSSAATATPFAAATTGEAQFIGAHNATLEGSIRPSRGIPAGATVRVYFQLGPALPYELQSVDQGLSANRAVPVLTGLQSDRLYHYRLVVVDSNSRISFGADRTFRTMPEGRRVPTLLTSVTPTFQFTFPAVVRVSGRVVPPPGVSEARACSGFVDITFRVRGVAVQTLRAGVRRDCTFKLSVRFSNRHRLKGGHISVNVLFVGNRLLQHRAAPPSHIQLG